MVYRIFDGSEQRFSSGERDMDVTLTRDFAALHMARMKEIGACLITKGRIFPSGPIEINLIVLLTTIILDLGFGGIVIIKQR